MTTVNLLSSVLAGAANVRWRPALTSPISIDDLRSWMSLLCQVQRAIPSAPLSAQDAQSLGGSLFLEGPLIVDLVVRAVRRDPALFAGLADAEALHGRQLRATGLLSLHRVLADLSARVWDLHLRCQSEVVSDVMALLRTVRTAVRADARAHARRPRTAAPDSGAASDSAAAPVGDVAGAGDVAWDRAVALCQAERVVRNWQRRVRAPRRPQSPRPKP